MKIQNTGLAALLLLGLGFSPGLPLPEPAADDYAVMFSAVLSDVLTETGRVRYDVLLEHPDFPTVVRRIEQFDFASTISDADRMALWMNAYNIHMLNAVSMHPGRKKVLGLDGGSVFFKTPVRVAGQLFTLDQIQNDILRKQSELFDRISPSKLDPRIHVGLNCAAVSCPRLWPTAFDGEHLDGQLDRAMRAFVDGPEHFSVEDGGLVASSLLDWYGDDFDASGIPAGDFLLGYMSPGRPDYESLLGLLEGKSARDLKDAGADFHYDWTVNRAD